MKESEVPCVDVLPTIPEQTTPASANILNLQEGEIKTVKEDRMAILRCLLQSMNRMKGIMDRGMERV